MRIRRFLLPACCALFAVIATGSAGDESADPGSDEGAGDDLQVEAMTFNIRYGTASDGPDHWRNRREQCIEVIEAFEGDVVGLQEAHRFQIDEIRERLVHYGEVGVGRTDGQDEGEHCTILFDTSRWRLDEARHGTFWLSDTPNEPNSRSWGNRISRITTWARLIEIESGRAVWIYNTHLDHRSQPSRERSAMLIAARVSERDRPDEPVIIMGDFNAGEDNPAMLYLTGGGELHSERTPITLIDTFRAVHPDADEVGTFNGFEHGRTGGEKIDHIFIEPGGEVAEAAIVRESYEAEDGSRRYPSDHFPVTATIRWPGR